MNHLKNKRVLVSGASGVIGRSLVDRLQKESAIIFAADLKPRPHDFTSSIRYWQGDLNYITQSEINDFDPECFFHLAATFERAIETYPFWDATFHHNVSLSHHLMSLLKDSKALKRVIFASSYLIYDPKLYFFETPQEKAYRIKEDDPIAPRNLCGAAKLLHELELQFLNQFKTDSYTSICARIYRVYGKNSKDIISTWINALLKGESLKVYQPQNRFDYITAEDVAEGLYRLAISKACGIVNLGKDEARSIVDVLHILKTQFADLNIEKSAAPLPCDALPLYEASQANMDRFKAITGWSPTLRLEEMIPKLIESAKVKHEELPLVPFNTLMTSISQKVPMAQGLKSALKKIGGSLQLIGADADDNAIAKHFVDQFYLMPKINDLKINSLIEYCLQYNIKAIIPSRDGELPYFAEHQAKLKENGISAMVSPLDTIEICQDKVHFADELKRYGFPFIATSCDIEKIDAKSFVLKERYGAGAINVHLNVLKDIAIKTSKTLEHPIFQPYIEGKEFSVDVYIDTLGKAKGAIARSRDKVMEGESQVTTTVSDSALESLCKEMSEKLKMSGHVVWQLIKDHQGLFHVIECNCRFGGASTLSLALGLDSFYWFLLESQGASLVDYPFLKSTVEKKQIRYKSDLIV